MFFFRPPPRRPAPADPGHRDGSPLAALRSRTAGSGEAEIGFTPFGRGQDAPGEIQLPIAELRNINGFGQARRALSERRRRLPSDACDLKTGENARDQFAA